MSSAGEKRDDGNVLDGSDESFDYVCQPCYSENMQMEAVSYCRDCCEPMCSSCSKAHGKLSATRHHTMFDKSTMVKMKLRVKPTDVLTDICPKHSGKLIEYFCRSHYVLCCSVCLTLDHDVCTNKNYVPDISDNIAESDEYKSLMDDLDHVASMATNKQTILDKYRENNDTLYFVAKANVKEFRNQFNDLFKQLEEDTVMKLSSIHTGNACRIKRSSDEVQAILRETTSLKTSIDKSRKDRKTNELFVCTVRSRQRFDVLKHKLIDPAMNEIVNFSFNLDEKLMHMKYSLLSLLSLSVNKTNTPSRGRYVQKIPVNSDHNTDKCLVSGIAILSGDRMVVTDHENQELRLVDMKNKTTISFLPLSSKPFDLNEIRPNQLAVALGFENKIEIVTVFDSLLRSQTISTPGANVVGLCYDGSNFIAACKDPGSIKIITMSGETVHTFDKQKDGEALFSEPKRIAMAKQNNIIYVTDIVDNTVTCMTICGEVTWVYTHEKLQSPWGIAVGGDDAVYVSSFGTQTVHQLNTSGNLTRIILNQEQGLAKNPRAIMYNCVRNMLFVSNCDNEHDERNYIKQYQFE